MEPYRFLVEQTSYDGVSYTAGNAYDTYDTWGIVCSKTPFRIYGDPKEISTRNWLDEHGEDAYFPAEIKLKKFDLEVAFLCNGTEDKVKYNVNQFLLFLQGMESKYKFIHQSGREVEQTIQPMGSRLAIYDGFNSEGWKDVRFKASSSDALVMDNSEEEVVLEFKVTFEVFDPFTKVEVNVGTHGKRIVWQD